MTGVKRIVSDLDEPAKKLANVCGSYAREREKLKPSVAYLRENNVF